VEKKNRTMFLLHHADLLGEDFKEQKVKEQKRSRHPKHRLRGDDAEQRKYRTDGIDEEYRLLVRQSKCKQSMMKMLFIRGCNRLLIQFASDDGIQGIDNRDGKDEYRDDQTHKRHFLQLQKRHRRKGKSQKERTRIPHENACGMEII